MSDTATRKAKPRRWWWWSVAAAAVLVAGGSAGAWAYARAQRAQLSAELVERIRALEARHSTRPLHVPVAVPGSFGAALLPAADGLADVLSAPEEPARYCVGQAGVPSGALTKECREALVREAPALAMVLVASHREYADPPDEALGALAPPRSQGFARYGWRTVTHALLLASVQIRAQVEARDFAAGVRTCLDALGVVRDASYGPATAARAAAAGLPYVVLPCASALDGAPAADKALARAEIERIRDAVRPTSAILLDEGILSEMLSFGWEIPRAQREELPPGVLALIQQSEERAAGDPSVHGYLAPLTWRTYRELFARAARVADLAPAEREAGLAAIERTAGTDPEPLIRLTALSLREVFDAQEATRAQLDALAVAAWMEAYRAQHGHWPSRVEISSATARLGYPPEVQTTETDAAISYPKVFGRGDEAYRIQVPLHAD